MDLALVFKIAWRNIIRHKNMSIVVGIILFLGSFFMTIGNGFIAGMNDGVKRNIVERFTGHVVLCATNQEQDNVLTPMDMKNIELLTGYTNIRRVLRANQDIKSFTPVTEGMATVLTGDNDMAMIWLMGVKFGEFQAMFETNIIAVEGRTLKDNERGFLLQKIYRNDIMYDMTSIWFKPPGHGIIATNLTPDARSNYAHGTLAIHTNMIIMGMSDDGMAKDVIVPVTGVFKYRQLDKLWQGVCVMDLESFRESFNLVTGDDAAVVLSQGQKDLLAMPDENLDNLFGDSSSVMTADFSSAGPDMSSLRTRKKTGPAAVSDIDTGAYNLVLIKLHDNVQVKKFIKDLSKTIKSEKLNARILTWQKAAGQVSQTMDFMRIVLYVFIVLLYLVAVIIITNTLSMSALERTSEIGMMRAVGARKSFIQNMFVGETFILSFFFGGIGIFLGAVLVAIFAALKLPAGNEVTQMLFGGDTFHPMLTAGGLTVCVIMLALVTLLSVVYPVLVARRITPLEAISRD